MIKLKNTKITSLELVDSMFYMGEDASELRFIVYLTLENGTKIVLHPFRTGNYSIPDGVESVRNVINQLLNTQELEKTTLYEFLWKLFIKESHNGVGIEIEKTNGESTYLMATENYESILGFACGGYMCTFQSISRGVFESPSCYSTRQSKFEVENNVKLSLSKEEAVILTKSGLVVTSLESALEGI